MFIKAAQIVDEQYVNKTIKADDNEESQVHNERTVTEKDEESVIMSEDSCEIIDTKSQKTKSMISKIYSQLKVSYCLNHC